MGEGRISTAKIGHWFGLHCSQQVETSAFAAGDSDSVAAVVVVAIAAAGDAVATCQARKTLHRCHRQKGKLLLWNSD